LVEDKGANKHDIGVLGTYSLERGDERRGVRDSVSVIGDQEVLHDGEAVVLGRISNTTADLVVVWVRRSDHTDGLETVEAEEGKRRVRQSNRRGETRDRQERSKGGLETKGTIFFSMVE
jgi:hypothetical protein